MKMQGKRARLVPGRSPAPAGSGRSADRLPAFLGVGMGKILSISYDASLLRTRTMILQRAGHRVETASSLQAGLRALQDGNTHLLVLCYSIPEHDQQIFIAELRKGANSPVLRLQSGQAPARNSDPYTHSIEYSPAGLLAMADKLLGVPTENPPDSEPDGGRGARRIPPKSRD